MPNLTKASPPATISAGPSSRGSDGDNKSISSEHERKRDWLRRHLPFSKPEKAKMEATEQRAGSQHTQAANTDSTVNSSGTDEVNAHETETQCLTRTRKAHADIFSANVYTRNAKIELPMIDKTDNRISRINSTPQLALCSSLLLKSQGAPSQKGRDRTQHDWIKAIENDVVEQDHLRWLGTRIVEEFSKDAVKDSAAVTEIVLLGPVIDREHYRKLLNGFIFEFEKAKLLDVHLLQGLTQLVQCASDGYLVADDLIKILSALKEKLQNTHHQTTEHLYHLTLALSRLLDVMAEHKVQDVKRVEEHEVLFKIFSGLSGGSDPFLMYQASYAFQALQYIPDDENELQAVLRHSTGVLESLLKISSVVKMDLSSVLDGLKGFQEALSSAYDTAKAGYEGFRSLMDSGRGVIDSLKEGIAKGHKRPWYPALRAVDGFIRQGHLGDLNRLIVEAPCRQDPLFQWGACQRLVEIALDDTWEDTARQQAMDLLLDLFKNDIDWAQDESVQGFMHSILVQLGNASDPAVKDHACLCLDDLKKDGRSAPLYSYPLQAHLPMPSSSHLLARAQSIPYVEYELHQLQLQRLTEQKPAVYIPPMAKANQQASDSDLFPLMEKVTEFLASEREVMLILGDSGAGKSTFNRHLECELWRAYKTGERIPLFINLPALTKPESELIAEQLRMHKFTQEQIRELELHRQLIVICDGYDESQLTTNLHTTNQLNRPGQWDVKLMVSCRSQYLGREYRDKFVPQGSDHYSEPAVHLFQEAVIAPFSEPQIESYVNQYVPLEPRPWVTKDYMEKLTIIPNLMDLVTNPFLLILTLGALPSVVKGKKDLRSLRINRVALYDHFVKHWVGANKRRLLRQRLEPDTRTVLAKLADDFEQNGIDYQKELAVAIFHKQDGKPFVDYNHMRDEKTWKAQFFSLDALPTLFRSCSLLNRVGNQHRFIHRSLLEYFYSRYVYEARRHDDEPVATASLSLADTAQAITDHPLSQRNLVNEPSIIQFLSERVQEDVAYKEQLLAFIELSKREPNACQAASNAITILVWTGVMFNGADLRGIRIPGADLRRGQFDSAQLQGADLSNCNLRSMWLRQADLSSARMADVHFADWLALEEEHPVCACTYSSDGEMLALGLRNGAINLYKTATWKRTSALSGHTEGVKSVAFSPSGRQIVSGSRDKTVRLWNAETGSVDAIFEGHSDAVWSVAFSPSGQQIASGSWDKTVRLWDAQTGASGAILVGHTAVVCSVVFSPSGLQIASGGEDWTVRLWDSQTGAPSAILSGHTRYVNSVAFSPSGQQIASGSDDNTVRLWDAQTGVPGAILSGHTDYVTSAVFSPSGQQLATGSWDNTVRLWDAQTGAPGAILRGHTGSITCVVFSPNSLHIASASGDSTMRLWDTHPDAPNATLSGHTSHVTSVAFSRNGQQVVSGSSDRTIRCWKAQTGVPDDNPISQTAPVKSVVFSPNGQQIVSGCEDSTVRLWDSQTGAPSATLCGHTDSVNNVVFSPSGQQVASGSDDRTVRIWDAQTGEHGAVLAGHTDAVNSVVFSTSGQQVASGSDDRTDAQTGEPGAVLAGHTDAVNSVVFSPSGQQVASGSDDQTVRLWDAQTGKPGFIFQGHTSRVMSVVFSPNGQQSFSGSWDLTVRLWDVESGLCLYVVKDIHGGVSSIALSAYEGNIYLATGSGDGSVGLWQVRKDYQVVHLRWSSLQHKLAVSDAAFFDVQGLSKTNAIYLEQSGALMQPTEPKEL
ncbi:unnamed protein product [Mortierella alpina]